MQSASLARSAKPLGCGHSLPTSQSRRTAELRSSLAGRRPWLAEPPSKTPPEDTMTIAVRSSVLQRQARSLMGSLMGNGGADPAATPAPLCGAAVEIPGRERFEMTFPAIRTCHDPQRRRRSRRHPKLSATQGEAPPVRAMLARPQGGWLIRPRRSTTVTRLGIAPLPSKQAPRISVLHRHRLSWSAEISTPSNPQQRRPSTCRRLDTFCDESSVVYSG